MGHYYERTASGVEPRHFVSMSTRPGELRPTRITDVKKWWKEGRVVKPSVTTVLDCLAKPALTNWIIDQNLKQAWAHGPELFQECEYLEDYQKEVKRLTEMEMDKAPQAGTDLHKLMQDFINGDMAPNTEDWAFCHDIYWEIECKTEFKNDDGASHYKTEVNFVSDLGYGGQIDLVIADGWIIDYKTKQTADKFKPGKMVYDEHSMQLAAYRMGIDLPKARCANLFVCLEDGQIDFCEHKEADLEKGFELFKHCLAIWNIQNDL